MKVRKVLREKIENNMALLNSIATSQNLMDKEKKVKQAIALSSQWQEENEQHEMTREEISELIRDVIGEIKRH